MRSGPIKISTIPLALNPMHKLVEAQVARERIAVVELLEEGNLP
jgi:hypothetical protein